jgi:hypothetical protein
MYCNQGNAEQYTWLQRKTTEKLATMQGRKGLAKNIYSITQRVGIRIWQSAPSILA